MQTPTWRSICAMLCLLLLLPALFPVKAAAETVPAKVVRVGSFEDTFNYVNEKGIPVRLRNSAKRIKSQREPSSASREHANPTA